MMINMNRIHKFNQENSKWSMFWRCARTFQLRTSMGVRLAVLSLALVFLSSSPSVAATGWNWYQVDTHVHSSVSADAFVDIGIISQVAQSTGYNAIFLTDHNGASNFQINNITANHNAFDDTFLRWDPADFGDPLTTRVNSVA